MTVPRLLYRICWRNRLLIFLILLCGFVTMMITFNFYGGVLDSTSGLPTGKKAFQRIRGRAQGQDLNLRLGKSMNLDERFQRHFYQDGSDFKYDNFKPAPIVKPAKHIPHNLKPFTDLQQLQEELQFPKRNNEPKMQVGKDSESLAQYKRYNQEAEDILNQDWQALNQQMNDVMKPLDNKRSKYWSEQGRNLKRPSHLKKIVNQQPADQIRTQDDDQGPNHLKSHINVFNPAPKKNQYVEQLGNTGMQKGKEAPLLQDDNAAGLYKINKSPITGMDKREQGVMQAQALLTYNREHVRLKPDKQLANVKPGTQGEKEMRQVLKETGANLAGRENHLAREQAISDRTATNQKKANNLPGHTKLRGSELHGNKKYPQDNTQGVKKVGAGSVQHGHELQSEFKRPPANKQGNQMQIGGNGQLVNPNTFDEKPIKKKTDDHHLHYVPPTPAPSKKNAHKTDLSSHDGEKTPWKPINANAFKVKQGNRKTGDSKVVLDSQHKAKQHSVVHKPGKNNLANANLDNTDGSVNEIKQIGNARNPQINPLPTTNKLNRSFVSGNPRPNIQPKDFPQNVNQDGHFSRLRNTGIPRGTSGPQFQPRSDKAYSYQTIANLTQNANQRADHDRNLFAADEHKQTRSMHPFVTGQAKQNDVLNVRNSDNINMVHHNKSDLPLGPVLQFNNQIFSSNDGAESRNKSNAPQGPIMQFDRKTGDSAVPIQLPVRQLPHRHLKGSGLHLVPGRKNTTYHNPEHVPDLFEDWEEVQEWQCNGKLRGFYNEFAHVSDVVLDQNYCTGPKGGEEIQDVLNQAEEGEYYKYLPGFMQMSCDTRLEYYFNGEHHLSQWLYSISTRGYDREIPVDTTWNQFTIAVTRYEYANIYHTMTDFYNAFLMMEFFNKTQVEVNILLVDGHPKGALDSVWEVLFNSVTRMSSLPPRTRFTDLAWNILGYNSPMMDHGAPSIPLVMEFRDFFLTSYRVPDTHVLNCDKLSVLFIWRHDYLAHPRNPTGTVSRKIDNEKELLESVRTKFPNFRVKGVQIDLFEMREQLQLVTKTDILLGMHGAGLTHTMFLPEKAAIAEFVPIYWLSSNEHFEAIARWRGHHFERWINTDPEYEVREHVTRVPPDIVNRIVEHLSKKLCDPTYNGEVNFSFQQD